MSPKPHPHTVWSVILGLLPIAVSLGLIYYAQRLQLSKKADQSVLMEESPQSSTSVTSSPVQPVAEVSPSSLPSSTLPEDVSGLPASVKNLAADFYLAFKNKDRATLATFFTVDNTDELISLRSRLFTGLDPAGQPGGPTLFSSNSAAQSVTSYQLIGFSSEGSGWVITVAEQRVEDQGKNMGEKTTRLTLVPQGREGGKWLVDSYTYLGSAGKYNAFLIQ